MGRARDPGDFGPQPPALPLLKPTADNSLWISGSQVSYTHEPARVREEVCG